MQKRILVVAVDRELFGKIDPLLNRAYFAVDKVPRGRSGAILCANVAFDLMLVGHPLPDMAFQEFLFEVRRGGSPCAASPLLVLTPEQRLGELKDLLAWGPNMALPLEDPRAILDEVATRLLGVAPRMATRIMVRLEVQLEEGKRLLMYQTENLSKAGMLIRTDHLYPIGTRVAIECLLPGDRSPLQGVAEVVRHAAPDVEKVHGVGVRFVELKGDGQKRLIEFLDRYGAAS